MSDQVSISHALRLLSNLEKMKENEIICDFTIKVANKTFPVHRAVLVASSDYFGGMFSSNMKEVREGRVEMKNLGVKGIQQSVEFMYTGSAQITLESVQDILHVAELFQLDGLKGLCFQFLLDNLSLQNCLSVINLADTYDCQDIKEEAERVVTTDFEAVISSDMFPSIRRCDLLRYISNVSYELSWKAAIKWANDKEEFPQLIEVMDIKEFPLHFLLETVLEEPLVKKSDSAKDSVISAMFSDVQELSKALDAGNCVPFHLLAKKHGAREAVNNVITCFMKENLEEVVTTAEICDLNKEDVIGLFQSPESKYSSETVKWEAVLKWVKRDIQNRRKVFPELFSFVKLDYLTLEFLNETVRRESLVCESKKCIDAVIDALFENAVNLRKENTNLQQQLNTMNVWKNPPIVANSGVFTLAKSSSQGPLPEEISPSQTVVINQQPSGGRISSKYSWPHMGIDITYSFPAGQLEGISYPSQEFKAYLSHGSSGKNCFGRLQKAFNAGHVFKLEYRLGQQEGRIIWGDIPHHTNIFTACSDGVYLKRLDEALVFKGF